jgi:hypothetical protein
MPDSFSQGPTGWRPEIGDVMGATALVPSVKRASFGTNDLPKLTRMGITASGPAQPDYQEWDDFE